MKSFILSLVLGVTQVWQIWVKVFGRHNWQGRERLRMDWDAWQVSATWKVSFQRRRSRRHHGSRGLPGHGQPGPYNRLINIIKIITIVKTIIKIITVTIMDININWTIYSCVSSSETVLWCIHQHHGHHQSSSWWSQVTKLKMYPYFDLAHAALCCLAVRDDLANGIIATIVATIVCLSSSSWRSSVILSSLPGSLPFSRKHPLALWCSTMLVIFAGISSRPILQNLT